MNAAGAWGAEVGALAGIDLPIRPLRRQIFVTDPVPDLDRDFPLTVEFASSLYFHRESGGVLMGMADPTDGPGFDSSVNWDFLPTLVERALYRLPILERANVKTGWAGFYEDTPDKHPIIGAVGVDGFLCAAGFSGHGIMHAPADGRGDRGADRRRPHLARPQRARVRSVPPRRPHQGAQRHLNALSLFLLLDLALVAGAAVLLLLVMIGRGRPVQYLSLAMLLIALAVGVWYTTIRSPVALP